MLKAMKPARLELIAMSKQAKVIQAQIESTTGDASSINSILLNMHSESAKTNIFKRFDEWKAAGIGCSQNQNPIEFGESH